MAQTARQIADEMFKEGDKVHTNYLGRTGTVCSVNVVGAGRVQVLLDNNHGNTHAFMFWDLTKEELESGH